MAKSIMIQGTMSNVGKTIITTALCRIFTEDGYRVSPFKSQNITSNLFTLPNGDIISSSQAIQAEAAGITPDYRINPIVIKIAKGIETELIFNGKRYDNLNHTEFLKMKPMFKPALAEAYNSIAQESDIVIIEGAGSPVELNLNIDQSDIANMGIALMTKSPVILVGDIDRGGIFATLHGTVSLLGDDRQYMKGFIINKFIGDRSIFASATTILEELLDIPLLGILPYINIDITDEDSLSERLNIHQQYKKFRLDEDRDYREAEYSKLATSVREHLDMKLIYDIINSGI